MSNFIVSARKYRPMRFDEVVGQNHVSKTLKNALKTNHLGHSFLFCGPRGVGKTTSARILAKVLNCENRTQDFEPCNECSSCTAFNENHSFNIYELDAASNNSVDNIRDLVEQVRFPPQQGQYKVYIIDEVHMLTQAAFNAFLKTLEEPPHYAVFILATTEKHKIIPTILSRCQIFDFNRVQVADIVTHLQMICEQEGITAEESALHVIAQKADGALRDALSIFDRIVSYSGNEITYQQVTESLKLLDYDTFFELTNSLLLQDKNAVLLQFDTILNNGFDGDQVMLGLAEHLRNLLVSKNPETLTLLEVAPSVRQRFEEQAQFAKTSFLLNALNIANACDVQFKQAKNKRLHVELALLKICYLGQTQKNVQLAPSQEAVKKNSELKRPQVGQPKKIEVEPAVASEKSVAPPPVPVQKEQPKIEANALVEKQKIKPLPPVVEQPHPASQPKTVVKKGKSALGFHLSELNQVVEQRQQETVAKNTSEEEEENLDFSENPEVSHEQIVAAWQSLKKHVKSGALVQGIANSEVEFENNKLKVTVHGKVIRDYLKEHHNLIIETIQTETGLKKFLFELDYKEVEQKNQQTFTKEDQLKYIQEKNPAVLKLCKDFELDINYD